MGDTVQKKTQEPWQPTQEPWKKLIERGGGLSEQTPDPFAVDTMRGALGQYGGLFKDTQGGYNGLIQQLQQSQLGQGPGASQQYLAGIASGQSGVNSPDFQQALNFQTDQAANSLKDRYAAAGRSFSGAEAGDWARNIGGIRAQTMAGQFNQDRAAQMQAAGQISGEQLGRGNLQLSRQGLLANTLGARTGALQGILGQQIGGATALQGAQDQQKWGDIMRYAQLLQGPNGGVTTEPGPNRLLQILGAIGGIGGLFGGMLGASSPNGMGDPYQQAYTQGGY